MLTQIKGRFLLKLDYRTYEAIKGILPDSVYKVEVFERALHMQKVKGGKRGISTPRQPRADLNHAPFFTLV